MEEREKGLWAGLALLVGGLIGVMIGLFYAPQSGKKTRHKIMEKGSEIADDIADKGGELLDKGSELKDKAMDGAGKLRDKI